MEESPASLLEGSLEDSLEELVGRIAARHAAIAADSRSTAKKIVEAEAELARQLAQERAIHETPEQAEYSALKKLAPRLVAPATITLPRGKRVNVDMKRDSRSLSELAERVRGVASDKKRQFESDARYVLQCRDAAAAIIDALPKLDAAMWGKAPRIVKRQQSSNRAGIPLRPHDQRDSMRHGDEPRRRRNRGGRSRRGNQRGGERGDRDK